MQKNPYRTRVSTVLSFLQGSKRYFVAGVLVIFAVSFLEMVNPQIVSYTVDSILGEKTSELPGYLHALLGKLGTREELRANLWRISLLVIGLSGLAVLSRYHYRVLNTRGAEKLVKRIRDALFAHIGKMPFSELNRNMTGDLIQKCTSDVNTVKRFVADQLVTVFRVIILLTLAFTFMFSMNVRLTLIAAIAVPIIMTYTIIFRRFISRGFQRCDEAEGVLSTIVQENLTGVRVVRAFGREAHEEDRFHAQNDVYKTLWLKLGKLSAAFWNIGDLISGLQMMTVLSVGTYFCVQDIDGFTAGQLIAFISYNTMMIWPVRQLARTISEMSKAKVSIDRICGILNTPVEQDAPNSVTPPLCADIRFENVSFSYVPDVPVLKNLNFTLPAGKTIGILGSTGSGKSTMMYLLTRLYEPTEGRILVGDVPLNTVQRAYLRRNIGIVLQEPFLFSRTLGENITIAREQTEEAEMARVLSMACLNETVDHFTQGLQTVVGERGVTLSGGQKQRTAIARTLAQNAPVVIFDDSLSAVDTETDARIRAALRETRGNATMLLISHRITTLKDADLILVLENGCVTQQGTHAELLAQEGLYRTIADIQAGHGEEAMA